MFKVPVIQTNRLYLDAISDQDIEALYDLFSQKQVVKYYDLPAFTSIDQAHKLRHLDKQRIETGTGIRWAIRLQRGGKLIGTCGFNSWNERCHSAVVGYDLHPNYWRKGISSEAVSAIIEVAFSGQLPCGHIHRIQADTIPGNQASERLLTKLGFVEEGLRHDAGYWKEQYHDLKCFGLLNKKIG